MEKLLDTIGGSCEKLRKKGIITDDEYRKCTDISDNVSESSLDSMQDDDNRMYLEKVYDTPSTKINNEQNSIYNRYKRIVNSNLESLKNAYIKQNKELIFRDKQNLDTIKTELKDMISDYETNIQNSKSHDIYKSMILRNREFSTLSKKLNRTKNSSLTAKTKIKILTEKNTIINSQYKLLLSFFVIILICILSLSVKLYSKK
jgi:hypothetical protein